MADIVVKRTEPGEVIGHETVFYENPELYPELDSILEYFPPVSKEMYEAYKKEHGISGTVPEKAGRFERLDYETSVYEDGIVHPKYCNVYLPWCYDPEDKERKYNVLYYQHGNTCDPELFVQPFLKVLLDRLFYTEGVEPCIVVCTTYYFDVTKDVEERRTTGNVPAGDGNYEGVKPNFWKEITQDLIPLVESRYNTYLAGTSEDEVKKARDHRAFSGYSRGCVATWYMFHNAFEFFRYFIPMSCMTTAGKGIKNPPTKEEVLEYLTWPVKKNPDLPFFVYALNGGPADVVPMTEQMKYVPDAEEFSYGRDPEKNNMFFAVSGYFHGDFFAPMYLYNALPVLFG